MSAHVKLREHVDLCLVLSGNLGVSLKIFLEPYCVDYLGNFDAHFDFYSNIINLNELVNVSPLTCSSLPS